MALSSNFNELINEYLPYDLLEQTYIKQCWLMDNAKVKNNWHGGKMIIPYQTAVPSSIKLGGLTSDTDVAEGDYARGEISTLPEAYGTLLFNESDLILHGKLNAQNFLKLLPRHVDQLMKFMKQSISISLLNFGELAKATAGGTASGTVTVDRIERFQIGQKLRIAGTGSTVDGYVRSINRNTDTVTFYDARTGGSVVDLSGTGNNTSADDKIYLDGGDSENFTSLIDQLLPNADGGSSTIFGQTKTDSTFTQAISIDASAGTAIAADKVLENIFDALTTARQKGADPRVFLLSYKHMGNIMKTLESGAGAYRHIESKVNYAGYTEIQVGSVTGMAVKIVAVREMSDDYILGINPKHLCLHVAPRSMFEIITSPDGNKYYHKRTTSGHSYLTDIRCSFELVYEAPWDSVIMHTCDY